MQTKLITAPATPILTTAAAKTFLRVDHSDEDSLIDAMISTATSMIEEFTNLKLITQTWDFYWNHFPMESSNQWWDGTREGSISHFYGPATCLKMPFGPLQSVTYFKTYDNADTDYTFDSASYQVDTISKTGRVALRDGYVWPATVLRPLNGIQVRAVVGYGNAASDVPSQLVAAVRETVAFLYENRGDENPKIPSTAVGLARPFRVENL